MSKLTIQPESVTEALERWDSGRSLFTIEMGGLGPGYEQALQIAMVELLRELNGQPLPKKKDALNKRFDAALHKINEHKALGLSGAQAGAAKSLAYQFLTKPWETVLAQVKKDRQIQISKTWPKA